MHMFLRQAGVLLLKSLVLRVDQHKQGPLWDILLPLKEDILILIKDCLKDNEPQVTWLASEVLQIMSWWP